MSAYTVLWIVSAVVLFIGLRDIFRILPRRPTITNLVICLLGFCFFCLGLGMSASFDEEDVPPPAPYAEHNKAVLATVKEGDLILCTDPASGQVKRAVLVRSANESPQSNPFWGLSISEGYAGDMRGWASDIFEGCQLSPPIRGTQLVDERIGRIVRLGLNPPTPK